MPLQTHAIQDALIFLPAWALVAILVLLSLWRVGKGMALFALLALGLVYGMGLWAEMVSTLALVIAASLIALLFGIPLGIAMARSNVVKTIARPVLDLMQTMPSFVYLIPAAMFFGLGQVPGTIATVIFAMPSIMAGVNQTIMLALSMVVIASMIDAGGLGSTVLTGIQRLDVGQGFQGGIAVVILAVILDRITQSFGRGGGGFSDALGLGSLLRKLSGRPEKTEPAA